MWMIATHSNKHRILKVTSAAKLTSQNMPPEAQIKKFFVHGKLIVRSQDI